jgi:hypothetical protein
VRAPGAFRLRSRSSGLNLFQVRPHTMLLACELLKIAVTILAHQNTLAGPVLDILRTSNTAKPRCASAPSAGNSGGQLLISRFLNARPLGEIRAVFCDDVPAQRVQV